METYEFVSFNQSAYLLQSRDLSVAASLLARSTAGEFESATTESFTQLMTRIDESKL